ncbi:phosphopantetheine-binding protein [Paenibacillus sp. FSL H3-0457]|uniref:phosphopantetheine-binding protein n=1 Tax=Paenibacillus sp. FSL H3-0457 TaxID=2921430 RepID=UPI0030ECE273
MSEIMTLETRIIQVIDKVMACGTDIQMDQAWGELGTNSLDYIKIVVEMEKEFDIEIDDDRLTFVQTDTISDFRDYLVSLIEGDSEHEPD